MNLSQAIISGHGFSLGEALTTGGEVTVLGLAIVFSVLIILMIVLTLFRFIFYKDASKKNTAEQTVAAEATPAEEVEQSMDEEELIAVLTAAVAASLNISTYNLSIKSYRRVENKKPAWNRAGINETINNRF